jgi:hypothetical protein
MSRVFLCIYFPKKKNIEKYFYMIIDILHNRLYNLNNDLHNRLYRD